MQITVREMKAAMAILDDDDVLETETGGDYETWMVVWRGGECLGTLDDFIILEDQ